MSRRYLKNETEWYDTILAVTNDEYAAYDIMDDMTYGAGDIYDLRLLWNEDDEFCLEGDIRTEWISAYDLRGILSSATHMLYDLPCEGVSGVIEYSGKLLEDIEEMEREGEY